ncbi:MAG: DUF2191 domain-containing protein [Nitrospirae bacterium]|nr:DUF2191 domain-containing protein [Nitrospirota bacterium]
MRTTLDLDDGLVRAAKRRALEAGTTLTRVIEDALRLVLRPPAKKQKPFRLKLLTFKGELRPGVDLSDRDSLYEIMEGRK